MSDLRYAFRQLLKSPGFTTIALITLALGIGLNTSMFSLTNFLLLQPLPFPDRDQLVRVYRTTPQSNKGDHTTPDYIEIIQQSADFAELAGYRMWSLSLAHADRPPVNLNALRVSANFFSVLGVSPQLGRFFDPGEDQPASAVVVLSHETWQSQFGGDPAIVGRVVRIDGESFTIVGVAPRLQGSLFVWGPGEVFHPLALTPTEKTDSSDAKMEIIGRVRSNLPLEQVNLRLASLAAELARHRPQNPIQAGLHAATLQSTTSTSQSRGLNLLLLALAGLVLLIACANLANLQLARAITRGREFAIRAALGASRSRLLRPLLYESLLLSLIGGFLGILVAAWTNDWLSSQLSANGFVAIKISLDWRVASFALAVATFTGVLFGLMPAWSISRIRANDALRGGTRGNTSDRAQRRLRHGLIIGQFALALVLLAGAGVLIRGFQHVLSRDAGWNHRSVLHGIVNLPTARYPSPEQAYAFLTRIQERLATLPSVEHVALSWCVPINSFNSSRHYIVEGREPPVAGREPLAFVNSVTPSYFSTLQIPLLAGRNFTTADNLSAPRVAIISESMARALFPDENPLGKRLGSPDADHRNWAEIVGVMPDQRPAISIVPLVTPFSVFHPLAQDTWNYATITLRASHAAALAEPMRRAIAELDPDLPVQQLGTVEERIELGSNVIHLTNTILVAFALLGLFLSALGLYGVVARLVLQRTPEIGVRVALGAQSNEVVWLILRSGPRLTLIGAGIGLLGSIGLVQLVARFLPDTPVRDPLPIIAVTLLLLAIALLACWLPARRASRVDPIVALRAE